jgi:hypothetical protein
MTGTTRWPRASRPASFLLIAIVGSLLVLWAAATGPVNLLGASSGPPAGSSAKRHTPRLDTSLPTYREITRGVTPTWDGRWLGELLLYAVAAGLVLAALLCVRWTWTYRWRPPARPHDVDFELGPEAELAEALESDADARLAAVERGGPRDGIVACWLRLEQTVGSLGLAPRPSETAMELVTRLLSTLDVDPRPVAALARLYGEARFSEHEMSEESRTAARSALLLIHADLRAQAGVS